jgi:hypothetical protein
MVAHLQCGFRHNNGECFIVHLISSLLVEALDKTVVFALLCHEEKLRLADAFESVNIADGTNLITQGELNLDFMKSLSFLSYV